MYVCIYEKDSVCMYVYVEKILCVCMYMLKRYYVYVCIFWKAKKDSHFYNCKKQLKNNILYGHYV